MVRSGAIVFRIGQVIGAPADRLRADREEKMVGLDLDNHGERASNL